MCDCNKPDSRSLAEQIYESLRPNGFGAASLGANPDTRFGGPAFVAPRTITDREHRSQLRVDALHAAITSDYQDKPADEIIACAHQYHACLCPDSK